MENKLCNKKPDEPVADCRIQKWFKRPDQEKKSSCKVKKCRRPWVLFASALLALVPPFQSAAAVPEREEITRVIYHRHAGTEEGSGCYSEEVLHIHEGNKDDGKGCYTKPILHVHQGNTQSGGSCYAGKVYHTHIGSTKTGGACYNKQIFHKHSGSQGSSGGCYTAPVLHLHQGSEVSGGGCFQPVFHAHQGSCQSTGNCSIEYLGMIEITGSYDEYCYHHGMTQHKRFRARYRHSACGAGETEGNDSICWTCQNYNGGHEYPRFICEKNEQTAEHYVPGCGKTNSTVDSYSAACGKTETTPEGYQLSCTKNNQTVDSYKLSCEKSEQMTDSYDLSCGKTTESVDRYIPGCGREDEEIMAKWSLSRVKSGWTKGPVPLEAQVTDEKFFLQLNRENPVIWKRDGEELTGKSELTLEAEENGSYEIILQTDHAEIPEMDLRIQMNIINIDYTAPRIEKPVLQIQADKSFAEITVRAEDLQPDGSPGSGLHDQAYSFDGGRTFTENNKVVLKKNAALSIAVRDQCGNVAKSSLTVDQIVINKPDEPEKPGESEKPKEPEKPGESEKPEEPEKPGEQEKPSEPEESENTQGGDAPDDSGGSSSTEEGGEHNSGNDSGGSIPEKPPVIPKPQPVKPTVPKSVVSRSNVKQKTNVQKKKQAIQNETVSGNAKPVGDTKKPIQKQQKTEEITKQLNSPPLADQVKTLQEKRALPPAVAVVTLTLTGLLALTGLLWAAFLWFLNVKIYYGDGNGKYHYAGSCTAKKSEQSYEITLPTMITEQSVTGELLLKPGYFLLKYHKGEELIVHYNNRKEAFWIEEEIPLHIPVYA